MFATLAKALFGSSNDRALKSIRAIADQVNVLEEQIAPLSDEELIAKTAQFRAELEAGKTLDDILPEAFASVREAAKRALGERHYDVQLMGGVVLHQGNITEMKTGEGKTLVSTLPAYLNAIEGKGVHLVTVNDYLAKRDSEWMAQVYKRLGLSVGCILGGMMDDERRQAYAADITYGTNNEFGFDYLRDNMKFEKSAMVQRGFNYAIVDEVDSILIDEARTPLIISGPAEDSSELYRAIDALIPRLKEEDYELDEKAKTVNFTEEGTEAIENILRDAELLKSDNLYDVDNISIVHHANQALRAHKLFEKDKDYIVKDNKVIIIDEFTGRMMDGRRFSDGLHQALEAKEKADIQPENQTLASITFQNYFRLYGTLSGMTGTASTEADEFAEIYKLGVVEVPTNRPIARKDDDDAVYRTAREKYEAIVKTIREAQVKGQPILVGTTSIEKSEFLSEMLEKEGLAHNVLNARQHEKEAQIVADAGKLNAITIATNMAGRGTDIKLGGNVELKVIEALDADPEAHPDEVRARIEAEHAEEEAKVKEAGGLFVLATERHESRRIDNQLRGRSGRQGDPGRSSFYLSLEDDLMRIFGSERLEKVLSSLGMKEGEAIIHPWVNKSLERAQAKVEGRNFDMRKNVLKFDDVMNEQRKLVFKQRMEIMESEDLSEMVQEMRHEVIDDLVAHYVPAKAYADQWDVEGLYAANIEKLGLDVPVVEWAAEEGVDDDALVERLEKASDEAMAKKAAAFGSDNMRQIEKQILLQTIDGKWREHLVTMEHLRTVIGFRGYAQRDPLNEYKKEAFQLFENMLDSLREDVTGTLAHLRPMTEEEQQQQLALMQAQLASQQGGDAPVAGPAAEGFDENDQTTWGNPGRNDPCPCGSGKKFKHCHGAVA